MKRREFLIGVSASTVTVPLAGAVVSVVGVLPAGQTGVLRTAVPPKSWLLFVKGELLPHPKAFEKLRRDYRPREILLGSQPRLNRPGIT